MLVLSPLCLLHQGVFIHGKTLLHLLSPSTSVSGVSVNGQSVQVTLEDVLNVQLGSPSQPLSACQFSTEKVFEDTAILHSGDMAQSAQVLPLEYGVHGGDPCLL